MRIFSDSISSLSDFKNFCSEMHKNFFQMFPVSHFNDKNNPYFAYRQIPCKSIVKDIKDIASVSRYYSCESMEASGDIIKGCVKDTHPSIHSVFRL